MTLPVAIISRRGAMSLCKWVLLVAVMFQAVGVAPAAPTPLKATNTWTGLICDENLVKEMPANGIITNTRDFEKLVKAWKIADRVPEVNFEKEFVLVATTNGSRLWLTASLDENGDVQVHAFSTDDLHPSHRYVIMTVPREGVKSVGGKELPK
jgi:hypothetical protein